MVDCEREVEVRSLTGESMTISISPNRTIEELKLLLKQVFDPVKNSSNFHLFFKGAKMILGNRISSYPIEKSDFIVVAPLKKKDRVHTQQQLSDQITETPKTSSFADSAWTDLMNDLSTLSDLPQDRIQNLTAHRERDAFVEGSSSSCSTDMKRKRGLKGDVQYGFSDEVLNSILCSTSKNVDVLDEERLEEIIRVSDSVNCLSDTQTGNCLFSVNPCVEGTKSCLCPSWLKMMMNTFSLVNIFSGFLQMQHLDVTLDRLKRVMKQLGGVGREVGIEDVERLSVLCPKVVRFGNQETEAMKLGDAIVIVDSSKKVGEQSEQANNLSTARKRVPTSKIVNMIKKREIAFKTNLRKAVKSVMGTAMSRNRINMFSLEDLLISVKDGSSNSKGSESKHGSSASSSHFGQTRCCDTNSLLPVEMVEHLRKGIGSNGQIVHVEEIGARMAVHVEIPNKLSEVTRSALKMIGVSSLYSHQAESIEASLSGKNVVVATMTSSGKSLCYNIPVLEALSQNLLSCALYLFPTKALAQDQLRALLMMTEGLGMNLNIGVYDGDTSQEDRIWLRDNARLVLF